MDCVAIHYCQRLEQRRRQSNVLALVKSLRFRLLVDMDFYSSQQ
jgi:hypothetical protein